MNWGIIRKKSWLLIFFLCFIYWAWLIPHTKMIIIFDSIHYVDLGRLIYQDGWVKFFQTGPHRELLYPALVALSMAWADLLSLDYQLILKVFQVLLLFSTQILSIALLRRLNLNEGIIKAAVIYFGISPAMINAAFSIYYEIIVFPFVVAVVLLAGYAWSDIFQKNGYWPILKKSILFGACFSLLAFGREIFQYIYYFFIGIFCILLVYSFFRNKNDVFRRSLVFVSAAFIVFYSFVSCVKATSFRYNGERVLSGSRLDYLLASAYKRSQPLTARFAAANIALIPGTGVCRMFFSQKECDYADWYGMNHFRVIVLGDIMSRIPKERRGRELVLLSIGQAIAHPAQYVFFSCVESLKMPFWESTKIGFVEYPEFLAGIYDNLLVRLGLRLLAGLITIAGLIFTTFFLWRKRDRLLRLEEDQPSIAALFFAWWMIAAYTIIYSTCYVVTRYALPIASLYIMCISFTINALLKRRIKAG